MEFSNKIPFVLMPIWLEVILEIIKISVPALIVFFTVKALFKGYLTQQYQIRQLEYKENLGKNALPVRLQAYERLSLFCERVDILNLTLRLRRNKMTINDLRVAMLLAVRQEFEHNISQQIYISAQLWKIVLLARDNTINTINIVSAKFDGKEDTKIFVQSLTEHLEKQEISPLETAQQAIRKETTLLL